MPAVKTAQFRSAARRNGVGRGVEASLEAILRIELAGNCPCNGKRLRHAGEASCFDEDGIVRALLPLALHLTCIREEVRGALPAAVKYSLNFCARLQGQILV